MSKKQDKWLYLLWSKEECWFSIVISLQLIFVNILSKWLQFHYFFRDCVFFDPHKLFNYKEFLDEKYFKKYILKPEEDKDNFGNHGCFMANKDYKNSILFTTKEDTDAETALMKLGVLEYADLFNVTKIVEWKNW